MIFSEAENEMEDIGFGKRGEMEISGLVLVV